MSYPKIFIRDNVIASVSLFSVVTVTLSVGVGAEFPWQQKEYILRTCYHGDQCIKHLKPVQISTCRDHH